MDYREAREFYKERAGRGSVMGLDSIRCLLKECGNPQEDLTFIHIAGTNGKGSVSAFLSSILKEAGIRTGTYTSPAVVSELERYQTDGIWIGEQEFADLTGALKEAAGRMEARGQGSPTVFELETALALMYFREKDCGLVVLETGLGGAEDATNVVERTAAAVFTSISRDHMGILGDTLSEIAVCKAGIMEPGCAVLSADQEPEVWEVLRARAGELGCPALQIDRGEILGEEAGIRDFGSVLKGERFSYKGFKNLEISLRGTYQMENGARALETALALRKQGYDIPDRAICAGLKKASWPGRFEILMERPLLIVDGAHNRDAALRLRQCVTTHLMGKRLIFIMGVFRDKEYSQICSIMAPLADVIYTVGLPDRGRSLPPKDLAVEAGRYGAEAWAADSVKGALDMAFGRAGEEDAILAFGSLSYLGLVMREAERRRQESGRQG